MDSRESKLKELFRMNILKSEIYFTLNTQSYKLYRDLLHAVDIALMSFVK
jgi:hypothetical protein